MNVNEALFLIAKAYPKYTISKVTEVEDCFLVSIEPKSNDKPAFFRMVPTDGCLKAVDKKTKKIFTYHPITHKKKGVI